MSTVPIYSEFGSRLGDNGGITEVLRDNPELNMNSDIILP